MAVEETCIDFLCAKIIILFYMKKRSWSFFKIEGQKMFVCCCLSFLCNDSIDYFVE